MVRPVGRWENPGLIGDATVGRAPAGYYHQRPSRFAGTRGGNRLA
jgi:hypothetical protein